MLVLSRKESESIVINGDVTVTVVKVRGNQVKIGINAPDEVPVHRQEVVDRMSAHDLSDLSLLVVSNDNPTRSAVAAILADEGGDVDAASSSARALNFIDEKKYDVAIIDESLDRECGQRLFARIKRYQSDLKGILCARHPTVDTVESAIDFGMEHVVQTPVDQAELVSLVKN